MTIHCLVRHVALHSGFSRDDVASILSAYIGADILQSDPFQAGIVLNEFNPLL